MWVSLGEGSYTGDSYIIVFYFGKSQVLFSSFVFKNSFLFRFFQIQ